MIISIICILVGSNSISISNDSNGKELIILIGKILFVLEGAETELVNETQFFRQYTIDTNGQVNDILRSISNNIVKSIKTRIFIIISLKNLIIILLNSN